MIEKCGEIYRGSSEGRFGSMCVRFKGHEKFEGEKYHGTEENIWDRDGGFYWHTNNPFNPESIEDPITDISE